MRVNQTVKVIDNRLPYYGKVGVIVSCEGFLYKVRFKNYLEVEFAVTQITEL